MYKGVCVHEGGVEVAAEEESIRGADILDDGVEEVQGWEFSAWVDLICMLDSDSRANDQGN